MPRPPRRARRERSEPTPEVAAQRERAAAATAADRVFAERTCRFIAGPEPRSAPLPPARSSGIVEAQLLLSYSNGDGSYTVIALDLADEENGEFTMQLGIEFVAYIAAHHASRNPADRENPHVPLFAHHACFVDLDAGTLTRGRWLGGRLARSGFERSKVHLGA